MSSHEFNSKINGLVLLFKTIFRHWNCFLSSVARGDKDGHKLKLAKIDLKITKPFIMVSAPCSTLFHILSITLKLEHFVYD